MVAAWRHTEEASGWLVYYCSWGYSTISLCGCSDSGFNSWGYSTIFVCTSKVFFWLLHAPRQDTEICT